MDPWFYIMPGRMAARAIRISTKAAKYQCLAASENTWSLPIPRMRLFTGFVPGEQLVASGMATNWQ